MTTFHPTDRISDDVKKSTILFSILIILFDDIKETFLLGDKLFNTLYRNYEFCKIVVNYIKK